ncbi:AAA family ATPase [Mycoplasmatota bacterium]|nr:AAA family ATPase [Mycoplasmatota bacterium]
MKKLVRIKLINWHLFTNQTVNIHDNCLLSGENGAGKSTFLDAIQYVLTGGKAKFNSAANLQAKRNLEGYLRCKLGIENKTYLRNKDVISHIALEFFDDNSSKVFIIGAILEINKSGRIYERFYVLKNNEIQDTLFVEDNMIRGYALFKKNLLKENEEVVFCDTKEQTRKLFLDTLGIKNDKYIELIPKALAFRPIDELNKFVFDFLLNEKNVSIDELRQNVRSYREFENLIESLSQKEAILTDIASIYKNYRNYEDKEGLLNQLMEYSGYKQLVDKENRIENELERIKKNINKTQQEELLLEKQLLVIQEEIEKINHGLNKNTSYQYYQELERLIKAKENEKKQFLSVVNDLNIIVNHEKKLAMYVFQHIKKEDCFLHHFNINQAFEEENMKNQMKEIKKSYEKIKEKLLIEINDLKKEKSDYDSELDKVNDTIYHLEKNQMKFDHRVTRLKTLIEAETRKIGDKNCRVYALCELIEVKDEAWRYALEGYLNTQRFDLIVDPIYFDQALYIYEKYKNKEHLYGVGLVNTKELERYKETKEKSLASKVISKHSDARCYVNMLLNRMICCEHVSELKQYKSAITKTCMVYKNYTARQINQEIYSKPYIGMEAVKLQLINQKKLNKELVNKRNFCVKTISLKEFYLERLKASQLDYVIQNLKSVTILHRINNELKVMRDKCQHFKINPEVHNLYNELKQKKEAYIKIEEKKKNCFLNEGKLSSDLENKKNELTIIHEEKLKHHKEVDSLIKDYFDDLMKQLHNSITKVVTYCQSEIKSNEEKMKESRVNLMSKMNQFNIKYHVGFSPTIDGINNYLDELNKIRNYELIKYQEQAKEARLNCEIAFKEQFIYKLRENIIIAHEELNYLNLALKNKRFGGDEYEFIYKASPHHEYGRYYQLIMKEGECYEDTLFTESISDQNKLILKELFDKLVIDRNDQEAYTTLAKFCDYRNYMSYDIKINHQNGESTYFSKVSREKSGGETQTPFYVVIAASFEQLMNDKKRDSPACFVLFDEAFNNMDDSRINAMMEFYHQLNIQLMISVPPQRVETIIEHVNTTLVVMKDEDKSFIESFSYYELGND